jgi:monovalent cation/hydrogen antiporter
VRLLWVVPGAYLPRLFPSVRRKHQAPKASQTFIIGWAGMRGVVSLAAALTLNGHPEFPRSHLVQFIAFSVILGTLVFQGLTLPVLIRWLGLADDGSAEREESEARQRIVQAVLVEIAEAREKEKFPPSVLDEVEHFYREHALIAGEEHAEDAGHHHHHGVRHLKTSLITTGHRMLVTLRRDGVISDEVLHKIEHELDLEEARLRI